MPGELQGLTEAELTESMYGADIGPVHIYMTVV